MSTVKFNAVQTVGSYQNEQGETKYNYLKLGVVVENGEGQLSLKLNALPLPNKKGEVWINLYQPKEE